MLTGVRLLDVADSDVLSLVFLILLTSVDDDDDDVSACFCGDDDIFVVDFDTGFDFDTDAVVIGFSTTSEVTL